MISSLFKDDEVIDEIAHGSSSCSSILHNRYLKESRVRDGLNLESGDVIAEGKHTKGGAEVKTDCWFLMC